MDWVGAKTLCATVAEYLLPSLVTTQLGHFAPCRLLGLLRCIADTALPKDQHPKQGDGMFRPLRIIKLVALSPVCAMLCAAGIALAGEQPTPSTPGTQTARKALVSPAARVTQPFPAKPKADIDPNNFFDEAAYLPYNIEQFGEPGGEKPAKSGPKHYKT
jgi:hypothetical protein